MKQRILKFAVTVIMIAWIGVSLFVICAEETPGTKMSDTMFFGSKLVALASIYGCCKFYDYMEKKGIIKNTSNEEDEWI